MQVFIWAIVLLIAYGLGNINGAIIISKTMMKDDVRTHGSGNAGLTNFFRTYGGFQSLLVIVIDVLKCVLACLIAGWLLPEYGLTARMAAGFAAIIGHSYPALAGFRGGKGILCGAALAGCVDWRVLVLILAVFVISVALTRYVSLGSVLAAATFAVTFILFHLGDWMSCILAALAAGFVIFRHRSNIVRLIKGNEARLSFHKK